MTETKINKYVEKEIRALLKSYLEGLKAKNEAENNLNVSSFEATHDSTKGNTFDPSKTILDSEEFLKELDRISQSVTKPLSPTSIEVSESALGDSWAVLDKVNGNDAPQGSMWQSSFYEIPVQEEQQEKSATKVSTTIDSSFSGSHFINIPEEKPIEASLSDSQFINIPEEKPIEASLSDSNFLEIPEEKASISRHFTLANALYLYNAKRNLVVTLCAASAAIHNPALFAGVGLGLASFAAFEYFAWNSTKYSTTALGMVATFGGFGLGVPAIITAANAVVSGVGTAIFKEAMFNPSHYSSIVCGGLVGFLNSNTGYFLTTLAAYGASLFFKSETWNNFIKEQVDQVKSEYTYQAKCEIGAKASNVNDYKMVGCIPVGWMVSPLTNFACRYLSRKVDSVGEKIADKACNVGANISAYPQKGILNHFEERGITFLKALAYVPSVLVSAPRAIIDNVPQAREFCNKFYQDNKHVVALGSDSRDSIISIA